MSGPPESWQEIGWNGIYFFLPHEWQPTLIYDSYLFFEYQGQPAFEIKWQLIQGRFSPERILTKLHKSLKPAGTFIERWKLPKTFKKLLPDHSLTGFQWQESNRDCRGILMYCPTCHRATLLQIYGTKQTDTRILENILASLTDHACSGEQLWSIYDIKALLPEQARLTSHEFLVGRFTLNFTLNGTSLTLYRIKPAGAVLFGQTLRDYGTSLAQSAPCVRDTEDQVTWSSTLAGVAQLTAKLKRKPLWTWLHLWHISEKNVILGVRGTGKQPMEDTLLNSIVEKYTVT